MDAKVQEFLNSLQTKNTKKIYKCGLNKFLTWLNMTGTEILEDHKRRIQTEDDKDFYRKKIQEYFNKSEEFGITKNSARAWLTSVFAFFSYYGFSIRIQKSFWKVQVTASDYVPTIEDFRRMFNVADVRGRLLISLSLDLGFRIGDLVSIRKDEIPTGEAPVSFERVTKKESVIAKTFISAETVELLKAYLPTTNPENPYLFGSNGTHALEEQSLNDILKGLAFKAKIQIPSNKKLRYHAFRKRFLSTCADLRIDPNIAKMLVGKSVPSDMEPYLSEVNRLKSWSLVREQLSLSNGRLKTTMTEKDAQIENLTKELSQTKMLLNGLIEAFGKDIYEKALNKLGISPVPLKPNESLDLETVTSALLELAKRKEKQDAEEYQQLITNGENNNHT